MRSFLVAVALVFAVVPSTVRAEAAAPAPVAQATASGVHYRQLSKMIRKFRHEAEARARERVLAQR